MRCTLIAMTPRREVCERFAEHSDLYAKRTAWSGPCPSWFKNGKKDGRLTMFPGSRLVYFKLLSEPRFEDYKIDYWSPNPFRFLGNGFDLIEHTSISCTYLEDPKRNIYICKGWYLPQLASWNMERVR